MVKKDGNWILRICFIFVWFNWYFLIFVCFFLKELSGVVDFSDIFLMFMLVIVFFIGFGKWNGDVLLILVVKFEILFLLDFFCLGIVFLCLECWLLIIDVFSFFIIKWILLMVVFCKDFIWCCWCVLILFSFKRYFVSCFDSFWYWKDLLEFENFLIFFWICFDFFFILVIKSFVLFMFCRLSVFGIIVIFFIL